MEIAFCRIDDRLIHGQIATVWSKVTGCNRIMCCSDEVAKDEMRKKLLLQVVPPGLKGYVVPVDKAIEAYKNPKYDSFKTLFLFTNPTDVVRAIKGGIPFTSVNLGGKCYQEGDTMISSAVSVSPQDVKALLELVEMGVEVEIRKLASDTKGDLMTALRAKGLV
ncbi:PTS system mannose/fructose/N-acetylgalactosamine-transporter subunit IIB [Selenomonas dianae]|uniref:Mannose/fructose/sorbose PTS transporter subunit IIB n=1 Tax=Selenomonas dianae TaxID=135079 RepID=A0ABN0SVD5_9FIRM|nr:mannose/fructose/sorbose PTS transporter subunit IIB [Selenomonas dianae]WLD83296.1 mannose/fructose/sorbose PTS transporter subunit IIB [Selenomonas dianae]